MQSENQTEIVLNMSRGLGPGGSLYSEAPCPEGLYMVKSNVSRVMITMGPPSPRNRDKYTDD